MSTVRSKDGTTIAYERTGAGPPLIIVDGALCYRDSGPARKVAAELADQFTAITYDRRGRGESGDTQPYSLQREIEDLDALIEAASGRAALVGFSSGAVLALEAARAGAAIDKVAAYEPPLIVDDSRSPTPPDYLQDLRSDLAAGRPGAAVKRFMRLVGMPGFLVALFPVLPNWGKLKRVAPTLPYDAAIMGDTQTGRPLDPEYWAAVRTPTVVLAGGKSPEWMANGTRSLAELLPDSVYEVLEGQSHMVKAKALAPALKRLLNHSRAERPHS
jgi:pimeloyl-ACP methyl ester carboxylesterase